MYANKHMTVISFSLIYVYFFNKPSGGRPENQNSGLQSSVELREHWVINVGSSLEVTHLTGTRGI